MSFDEIIAELERQTADADRNAGIALGDALFNELLRRSLIRDEAFSWLGTGAFPLRVAAFEQSHAVVRGLGLGPRDFQVGGREVFRA